MITSSVTIIDLGIGNLYSVSNAFSELGVSVSFAKDPLKVLQAEALVLPGVGSFAFAMGELQRLNLVGPIKQTISNPSKKILGICLGFQLMGLSSTEDGFTPGLALIPASVTAMRDDVPGSTEIPHIGFNTVESHRKAFTLEPVSSQPTDFYFVHSYCYSGKQIDSMPPDSRFAITHHGTDFISAYHCKNIFGAQFHPEKSQTNGLAFLKSFIFC